MQCSKTSTILCAGLLVILALPTSSSAWGTRAQDESPAATSVLTTPIPPPAPWPHQQQRVVDNAPLDPAQVRKAIRDGVRYLKSKQLADGSWQKYYMPGDKTALCTLALLNSGENPNDPQMKAAIEHIRNLPTLGTYFVSLRIMVLATADPKGKLYRLDVDQDVKWLLEMQVDDGPSRGGWSYGQRARSGGGADGSNSQFALLALHEASQLGIKIEKQYWERAKEYWSNSYSGRRGGFTYNVGEGTITGSMTCAGISSWIIIHENLSDVEKNVRGEFANCCLEDQDMDKIKAAFNWLAKHFTVKANPRGFHGSNQQRLYYLYGLERADGCRESGSLDPMTGIATGPNS